MHTQKVGVCLKYNGKSNTVPRKKGAKKGENHSNTGNDCAKNNRKQYK